MNKQVSAKKEDKKNARTNTYDGDDDDDDDNNGIVENNIEMFGHEQFMLGMIFEQ